MQQNEHNFQMAILREPTEVLADPTAEDFGEIGTYVNPFTDFGFKRLFGQELSSDILIDFLNEVLADKESPIKSITYLNNEQQPEQKDQRRASFDLHCKTANGARIIIEMQAGYQRYIVERSLYYASRVIGEQAPRGEWDFSYDRIYSIVILDFNMPESSFGSGEVRHEGMLMNTQTTRPMSDKLVLIFLEMRNFVKTESQLVTRMDKWLYLLRNLSRLTSRPKAFQDRIFIKIFTLAKVSEMDTKEYAEYQRSMKAYWDWSGAMRSNYELGVEKLSEASKRALRGIEGIEKGIERGIEKGIEQGLEKGLEEGRLSERINLAKRLHQKGMPVAEIADLTGLSEAEIKDLLN
jgi:predicted transposase/invertase (TIGR01784 family)